MNEKEELIIISMKLNELSKQYKSLISENIKNKRLVSLASSLSNSLMVAYRNIDDSVLDIIKLDKLNGKKYEQTKTKNSKSA